ncbi:peptide ABC transporter ATP-binding protein [Methanosarcina sp. 2.H.T.1A.6]|uniref:ABC transporter ATP-binding protein n=1 Tax=unclassified Methanosarcina TaxID=2644672 RepID=UPI0006229D28|nr:MULTISPECIES: ABC transporter ATP-binding protein [unclassified Methanosarcina]KKG16220.1 peptide ABC transporter ATP-binding protein [Methanosarcina sp. 2.H.T.1A.3]KKG20687.1 peptide ABC transporter ATP-binding protein [Methanosarcina sp. 2.H.T.1A.15]KKG23060.1 peptide ABC transporter ATP-binding protein [Methanosarcina sp. 2.H.T.1A.6]KKG26283.1 peptide ABC transporter ATP-binding protein [Methanosarcina sp. 2.H.T.1A.8]
MSLLEIRGLSVEFPAGENAVKAVSNVSFEVEEGETFGLIGESGSGKSVIGLALLRLLPESAVISGEVIFQGQNLFSLKPSELRNIRGKKISLMPQNPAGALNPVLKNGLQIEEVFEERRVDKKEGMKRSLKLMKKLFLTDPEKLCTLYPHQLSGGMRQRLIACMSLSFEPELLIADEPTKGLDPEAKAGAVDLFTKIKKEYGKTMLLITHDLDLALEVCDRIAVMYAGEIVELNEASKVLNTPVHPYTKGLISAQPRNGLVPLRGQSPSRIKLPEGCFFNERCRCSGIECSKKHPEIKKHKGGWVRCHFQSLQ